jgi:hypothetical protein
MKSTFNYGQGYTICGCILEFPEESGAGVGANLNLGSAGAVTYIFRKNIYSKFEKFSGTGAAVISNLSSTFENK